MLFRSIWRIDGLDKTYECDWLIGFVDSFNCILTDVITMHCGTALGVLQ